MIFLVLWGVEVLGLLYKLQKFQWIKIYNFYGPSSIQVARSLLISASEWTELSDSIVFSKQERFFPPDI